MPLYKLALKCGVVFNFNKNVEMIFHDNGKVTGLKIDSEKMDFDIVVSNADVNFTYLNLLKEKTYLTDRNDNRLEPSSSAIVFYWGVEGNYGNLEIHNILFSKDYQTEFNEIFGDKSIPNDPTVYIYISSKFKANDAPQANENWFIMINAPYNHGQNWDIEIEKARKSIINKISNILKIDISTKILFEKVMKSLWILKIKPIQIKGVYTECLLIQNILLFYDIRTVQKNIGDYILSAEALIQAGEFP